MDWACACVAARSKADVAQENFNMFFEIFKGRKDITFTFVKSELKKVSTVKRVYQSKRVLYVKRVSTVKSVSCVKMGSIVKGVRISAFSPTS